MELQDNLQSEIAHYQPLGAFVKLSVRSPKDAVFSLQKTKDCIREYLKYRGVEKDSPVLLSENIAAIRHASWQVARTDPATTNLQK